MPSADEQIDDGLLVCLSAVRLAVTNRIIVDTVRDGMDHDDDRLIESARAELLRLAAEKRDETRRVVEMRSGAVQKWGQPSSSADYRMADADALARRAEVSTGLAERLEAMAGDPVAVRSLADRAHQAALDEFATSVELLAQRMGAHDIPVTQDDRRIRNNRLDELRDDLKELRRQRAER
ncbi:hypothetical protein ACFPJ4_02030 [Lysinimonas soli]|uniref:Asparagine synthase n=1 Tax=Lysinimonas soli TaxID=1074233 RepID=A0ABW0NN40_9MICO